VSPTHVPEDLLLAFVECEVDEQLALHIATHLDECPMCATRAASMEPLAAVFAAVEDPVVPEFLVQAILREARQTQRSPAVAFAVGTCLLAVAVILLALGTDPGALVIDMGRAVSALPNLGALVGRFTVSLVGLALAFSLFVAGSSLAIRRARQEAS
jgi:predicted anti-sigma-YlaC factor YlaD